MNPAVYWPQLNAAVEAGDGLVFDAADWRSPQEAEEGGRTPEENALSILVEIVAVRNGATLPTSPAHTARD